MDQSNDHRNINYDLMRSVSAFAVVWLHVAAQFVTTNPENQNFNWWVGNIADALSRWCVPVFVMLSGALLLDNKKNIPQETFYRHRLSSLLLLTAFWSCFYIAFSYITEPRPNTEYIIKSIIIGKPYFHLWYLYMAIGLYMITPYLRIVTRYSDQKSLLGLIVFSLSISSIEFLAGAESKTFLPKFLAYIGFFLGGYYLSIKIPKTSSTMMISGATICGVVIALLTSHYITSMGSQAFEMMYGYLNPLVIIMSFLIFSSFAKIRIENSALKFFIKTTTPFTLGIYLIHPIWMWLLNRYIFWRFQEINFVTIPIFSISTFTLSIITAYLISKIKFYRPII